MILNEILRGGGLTLEDFEIINKITDISASLVQRRIERNITQTELAEMTGLCRKTIVRLENCENPCLDTLLRVAKALDLVVRLMDDETGS